MPNFESPGEMGEPISDHISHVDHQLIESEIPDNTQAETLQDLPQTSDRLSLVANQVHHADVEQSAAYEQPTLDRNHREVIESSRYFDLYKEELHTLFAALNRENEWSDDPREMIEYVESRWIGREHGNGIDKDQFSDEEIAAAMPILERIGLLGEIMPPDGVHYDQILVPGATLPVIDRRMGLVKRLLEEHQITTDTVELLAGERPLTQKEQVHDRYPDTDFTQGKWVQAREASIKESGGNLEQLFRTETDASRAAVIGGWSQDGATEPSRVYINLIDIAGMTDAEASQAVKPPLDRVEYEVPVKTAEGSTYMQKLKVLNAASVPRPQGDPRPTSASQMQEYIEREAPVRRVAEPLDLRRPIPLPQNDSIRILYVSSNPHTLRMACDAYRELLRLGRNDIQMDVAGVRESPEMPIQTALGELGRLIANDVRRNYPPLALPDLMAA